MAAGGVQKNLSGTNLAQLPLLLPPLPEQRKIAAILTSVDEAIEGTQAVIEQLGVVKKAMMAELLTRGIPGRHSKFKATELGEVPADWEMTTLGGTCHIVTGRLDSNAATSNGKYPFFTCSQQTLQIDQYSFDCEAILFAGNNAMGVYSVKHFKGKFDAYQRTYVIRIKDDSLTYSYLKFRLEYGLEQLTRLSTGTGTKFLTMQVLNPLVVPLPPIEEQLKIGGLLGSTERRISAEQGMLDALKAIKSALMSVLLTGEVRVHPDEDAA
jgi:type I restriction enzyme S subunit